MNPIRRLLTGHALVSGLAATALLLALPVAQAQWKWRDASGRIQLSDMPPPAGTPDKDILQRPAGARVATPPAAAGGPPAPGKANAPAAGPATAKPVKAGETELDRKRKAAEQEDAAKAKAEEQRQAGQRQENCRRAQGAVAALEGGQRVTRVNARGEREFLDDGQRADELRRAREVVASDCR
jgi:hypothetical protein